jgi:hypothetical protein
MAENAMCNKSLSKNPKHAAEQQDLGGTKSLERGFDGSLERKLKRSFKEWGLKYLP